MARWQRDAAKERMWRRHVARWQRSGLSIRDYCATEGLAEANFYAWRRTLTERNGKPGRRGQQATTPAFVPVRVVNDRTTSTARNPVEVVCANGRVLRVGADFDPRLVRQLLTLLEEPAC
jgi:hypothetical protein